MRYKDRRTSSERLEATPIARIVACDARTVLGWRYKWNTGEIAELWITDVEGGDYRYEPIQ